MFKHHAMGNTRARLIAGVVLTTLGLSAAGTAMSTDVFGGGATLPAGGYVGWDFVAPPRIFSANVASPSQPAAAVSPGSLLGHWAASLATPLNAKVAYCQTGSGNGKKIFDHSNGMTPLVGGTGFCDGTTSGFGQNAGAVVDPHFAGSDAPMSQDEFNWFGNGSPAFGQKTALNGQPVQFPSIVGAVAIPYNNPDAPGLDFTDAGLCKIFTGQISNWNQLISTDFNTAPSAGLPLPSRDLHLAYRSDGSGTTFSLANHLSTVCGLVNGGRYQTDQAFTVVTTAFAPLPLAKGTVGAPANFSLPAPGNPGVVTAVDSNPGAIGYAEAANLVHSIVPNTTVANVGGKNPITDLAGTVTLTTMLVDQVIAGVNADGTPHVQPLVGAVTPGCVLMVNPASYALGANYPIVAVSNLILNQKGNGTDTATLQSLMTTGIYGTAAQRVGITTVGPNTGYAFVTAPVAKSRVNTCITI